MENTSERELKRIEKRVAAEFPGDPALQQVHVARRLLALAAKSRGLTLPEYIRSRRKRRNASRH
jgi:hypothetical protein